MEDRSRVTSGHAVTFWTWRSNADERGHTAAPMHMLEAATKRTQAPRDAHIAKRTKRRRRRAERLRLRPTTGIGNLRRGCEWLLMSLLLRRAG